MVQRIAHIEMFPAYCWHCPECGVENYARVILRDNVMTNSSKPEWILPRLMGCCKCDLQVENEE